MLLSRFHHNLFFCILIMILWEPVSLYQDKIPKAAVIGGGIGGTASAFFLRQLFGHGKLDIDLYESSEIGGRLAVAKIGELSYEMGGSIIHPRNKYMTSFVRNFGLTFRDPITESHMGLWDGSKFVFEESSWEFITMFRLLWRYGMGPLKLQSYINNLLDKFDNIYTLQNRGEAFESVSELLRAMHPELASYQHVKTSEGFKNQGFSDIMIDELVSATIHVNYGQNNSIHQFVGSVSVAGATGNLLAIEGGNYQVPKKLLEASEAQFIHEKVLRVSPLKDGKLAVERRDSSAEDKTDLIRLYDMVILAAPLQSNAEETIDLSAFHYKPFAGLYHHTISTILEGYLNHSYFGFDSVDALPNEIIVTHEGPFFNSVSRIYPVNGKAKNQSNVWKVFSSFELTDEQLNLLFIDYDKNTIQVKDWLAYPHYSELPRSDEFCIHHNFYYLNSVEWAASAMEMSVIGAKNVALLAHERYHGDSSIPKKSSKQTIHSLQKSHAEEL